MKHLALLALLFACTPTFAQFNLDSLYNVWLDESQPAEARLQCIDFVIQRGYIYNKPDSAFILAQQQLEYARKVKSRIDEARAIKSLGVSHVVRSNYNEARKYYDESLAIFEEVGDKDGIARVYSNIGNVEIYRGQYLDAKEWLQKAFDIFKELGNPFTIAASAANLGNVYLNTGEYDEAITYYEITNSKFAELGDSQNIASSYTSIATAFLYESRYEEALIYFNKARDILNRHPDPSRMSHIINNIALIKSDQGHYNEAMDLHFENLAIDEAIGDKRGMAASYQNIGSLYNDQGYNEKSMEYYEKSLKLAVEVGSKAQMATAYGSLASRYYEKGDKAKAMDYAKRDLDISRETGDKASIQLALLRLGRFERGEGNVEKALAYYETALDIAREIKVPKEEAMTLREIGHMKELQEEDIEAKQYIREALVIAEELHLVHSLRYCKRTLYRLHMLSDSVDAAAKQVQDLLDLNKEGLVTNFNVLPGNEREKYFRTLKEDYDLCYNYTLTTNDPLWRGTSYDNTLMLKGLLLNRTTAMKEAILATEDESLIKKYYEWIGTKRKVAKAYESDEDPEKLEELANQKEKSLLKDFHQFAVMPSALLLRWEDVRDELKNGEVAIEFVRFHRGKDIRNWSDYKAIYCALVLKQDSESPEFVELFAEEELSKILGEQPSTNEDYIEHLYGKRKNPATELYDLIWKPLEPTLGNAKQVYLSPAGLLHKISFPALAIEKGKYLEDRHGFEILTSTARIAERKGFSIMDNENFTLIGGVKYDSDSTKDRIWTYLPGTKTESERIRELASSAHWDVTYLSDQEATEEMFKTTAASSHILHVATHGFFYPEPQDQMDSASVEVGEVKFRSRGGSRGFGVEMFLANRNPLMRSGIVLAGANDVWNRKKHAKGDDGVLTAQEVSNLDMRKTGLVVLSACETGLGEIHGAEGVYGLQRAFKMAGVKFLIISLWQVPDAETVEFMTTFYQNLTDGMSIREAFNDTQRKMRDKYDPYFWAAFVLVE